MALLDCKECGKQVSTKAKTCPSCGAKVTKPLGIAGWVLIIFTAFVVIKCSSTASNTRSNSTTVTDPKEEARFQKTAAMARLIKSRLREPESMTLDSASANDDASVICIEYRAKNGFGGMNHEFIVFCKRQSKSRGQRMEQALYQATLRYEAHQIRTLGTHAAHP